MQTLQNLHLATIWYMKGTSTCGLFFSKEYFLQLLRYSDVHWTRCANTRCSITGRCMFLGNALIFWKNKKQDRVFKSPIESEHRAMSSTSLNFTWLSGLLGELEFSQLRPTPLDADNTNTIQIAANPIFYEHTKHIKIDCHFIRESFEQHLITLSHISTEKKMVNIFTKALSKHRHQFLVDKLIVLDLSASI